jgi:hypothetical protein
MGQKKIMTIHFFVRSFNTLWDQLIFSNR